MDDDANERDAADAIPVLWDGQVAAAVRKPAGLLTEASDDIDSLQRRLRAQFSSRTQYLAMVHRLDRPVSGVLLVAFTKRAARLLGRQFASRKVDKSYIAVLSGRLPDDEQRWIDRLAKREGEARVDVVAETIDGKHAETWVEVVRHDASSLRTLVRLRPRTGRMHQLRVQASVRGVPMIGDTQYGGPVDPALPSGRIALHAESLTFHDPRNGVRMTVSDRSLELESLL